MKKGIDVSYHQKSIDWEKVKASGIDFAIIRAGYGRTTIDNTFRYNVEECIRLGIPFGVYWFIYGVNEAEAIKNAEKCYEAIAPYKNHIDLKVWCDLEYDTDKKANGRGVVLTKNIRTAMVIAFCERMKQYGFEVGNYANPDYLKTKFKDLSQYPLWLAKYSDTKGDYDCFMWQYTSKGKVDGITGNVDMNYLYVEEDDDDTVKEVSTYIMPTIKKDSKGKAVQVWQVIVGCDPDGIFGKKTLTATKTFQKNKGLLVDGIVGKESWKAGLESLK